MTGDQVGDGGVAMRHGVSDEVWRAIAPEGDRAAPDERPAMLRVVAVVATLTVVAAAAAFGGVVTPRLDGGMSSGGSGDGHTHTSTLNFEVHNDGLLNERIEQFESSLPGLEVTRTIPDQPVVARRSMQSVYLTLHATDCRRLVPAAQEALGKDPASGAGVVVVVHRPWGSARTTVNPPSGLADMALIACGVEPGAPSEGTFDTTS